MSESEKRSRKPGCSLWMFLIGAAAIGGGAYLMGRWEAIPGAAKAGAVVLVVLGTLMVLPFLLLMAIKIIIKRVFGKLAKEMAGLGEQIVNVNKAMYGQVHSFREATDEDFEKLDRQYYEASRRQLMELGYRHLGDIVDETIESLGQPSPVIRVMASADGSTMAGLYHVLGLSLPAALQGQRALVCDLATEFNDGTFLITANTAELDLTTPPREIERRQHTLTTPLAELVKAHEPEKQKLLAAKPGVTCVQVSTLADAMESEKRQQAVKNAYRKQIGYVDPQEVRRVAEGMEEGDGLADLAAGAADEARRKEKAAEQEPPMGA